MTPESFACFCCVFLSYCVFNFCIFQILSSTDEGFGLQWLDVGRRTEDTTSVAVPPLCLHICQNHLHIYRRATWAHWEGKGSKKSGRGGRVGWGGYRSPLWPRHHTIWFKTLSTLTLLALFHVSHTLTREVFEKLKTFPPTLFLPKMPTPASQNLFQNSHHRHRFHHHHHHHAQA